MQAKMQAHVSTKKSIHFSIFTSGVFFFCETFCTLDARLNVL